MDSDNALSVQNAFFNQVRKDRTKVSVLLNNGQRIAGVIKSFDKFTFLLDTRHGEQMIFKHAVSAVSLFKAQEGARPQRHPSEAQAGGDDAGGNADADSGGERERRTGKPESRFGNFIRFDEGAGKS